MIDFTANEVTQEAQDALAAALLLNTSLRLLCIESNAAQVRRSCIFRLRATFWVLAVPHETKMNANINDGERKQNSVQNARINTFVTLLPSVAQGPIKAAARRSQALHRLPHDHHLAAAMALHPRLGSASPLSSLHPETLASILLLSKRGFKRKVSDQSRCRGSFSRSRKTLYKELVRMDLNSDLKSGSRP